jgi:hypothetical protein
MATPVPSHDTTRESLSGSQQDLNVTLLHSNIGRYVPLLPPSPGLFKVYQIPSQHQACNPLSSGRVSGLLCSKSEPFYGFSDPSIACSRAFLPVDIFLRGLTLLQLSLSPYPGCMHDLGRFLTRPSVSSVKKKLVGQSWGLVVIFPIVL